MIIGILGAGQLAQMLAQAGEKLGHTFIFLDPNSDACAFPFGKALIGNYDDSSLLEKLAQGSDMVTFEFENVPFQSVEILSKYVQIHPNAKSLEISQDRIKEKQTFGSLGIPTTKFVQIDSISDFKNAADTLKLPAVLKTRSQGYDGKGQKLLRTSKDMDTAWQELGRSPLILEEFISFDREISQVAARNAKGDIVFYSVSENVHREGILRTTHNRPNDPMEKKAQLYARKILEQLDYVGTFALEMFQQGEELLANEMAPRVHNSGHWTIEGSQTSQFENHLRAISNQTLRSTQDTGYSAMINCIGQLPREDLIKKIPNTYFHDYHKELRPGRKVGHITVCAESNDALSRSVASVLEII